MSNLIQLHEREHQTKHQTKALRKQGKIPAVVYGKEIGSIAVSVDEKKMISIISQNPRAVLEASIPGQGTKHVLIQDFVRDMTSNKIMHIDFHEFGMNERIETRAAIHYKGEAVGAKKGGFLQIDLFEVEIRCLPQNLVSSIEIDVSKLNIGEKLTVSDLPAPVGIEIMTDKTTVLASVLATQLASEEEVAEPAKEAKEAKETKAVKPAKTAEEAK